MWRGYLRMQTENASRRPCARRRAFIAQEARAPNVNELRSEIAALHAAAERKRCGQVADLLEKLSQKASRLLSKRATRLGLELPASADFGNRPGNRRHPKRF